MVRASTIAIGLLIGIFGLVASTGRFRSTRSKYPDQAAPMTTETTTIDAQPPQNSGLQGAPSTETLNQPASAVVSPSGFREQVRKSLSPSQRRDIERDSGLPIGRVADIAGATSTKVQSTENDIKLRDDFLTGSGAL